MYNYNRQAKLVSTLSANKPCDIRTISWIRHSRSFQVIQRSEYSLATKFFSSKKQPSGLLSAWPLVQGWHFLWLFSGGLLSVHRLFLQCPLQEKLIKQQNSTSKCCRFQFAKKEDTMKKKQKNQNFKKQLIFYQRRRLKEKYDLFLTVLSA